MVNHLKASFEVITVARRLERMQDAFAEDGSVTSYQADLSDGTALERVLNRVVDNHGSIPYVINNAGINMSAPVEELDLSDMRKSLEVNAIAPLRIMQRLLPAMVNADFGRIVNVTSGAPLNCFPEYAAYSASKATLNAIMVTAAREHEDQNIRINLMSPGPVRTEMAPEAPMDPSVCHPTLDYLLSLPADGPTGRFFWLGYEIPLFPDLEGIEWLEGKASDQYERVL
jgi:NAD(P)-dependent dehydrogenase (short-subunit alcohol dehydrogenase family)